MFSVILNMLLGTTVVISPNDNLLINREFLVIHDNVGEYTIVDLTNEEGHQITKKFIKMLNSFEYSDDEICELMVYFHEQLINEDDSNDEGNRIINNHMMLYKKLQQLCSSIYSPDYILNTVKGMSSDELIDMLKSTTPLKKFNEYINIEDYDDYGDYNHVQERYY